MDTIEHEEVVGNLLIKYRYKSSTIRGYFSAEFIKRFCLKEFVFDTGKMIVREPTMFDNKTFKISARHQFSMGYMTENDMTGSYKIVQTNRNEKIFQLIPVTK